MECPDEFRVKIYMLLYKFKSFNYNIGVTKTLPKIQGKVTKYFIQVNQTECQITQTDINSELKVISAYVRLQTWTNLCKVRVTKPRFSVKGVPSVSFHSRKYGVLVV